MSIWSDPAAPKPLIGAHRGASSGATENGRAAMEAALHLGADFIEVDVRLTVDGQAVAFHDADFRRLTGDPRALRDLPLSEARALWPDLMTIAEVASLVAGRAAILLDVKPCVVPDRLVAQLGGLIDRHDVALGLRGLTAVQAFAGLFPHCPRLGLFSGLADYSALVAAGGRWARLWQADATASHLATLRGLGLRVIVMAGTATPEGVGEIDDAALASLIALGPDAIMLNDPARALRLRSSLCGPEQSRTSVHPSAPLAGGLSSPSGAAL